MHVGDLDGFSSNDGSTWSATVEVTIHDASHNPINGATVTGFWDPAGLASDECTTGELGGNGTCIVLFPGIQK
ncbi:MAG: peptidase S8, partial [Actinobacteria bacterium]|nr:peptidase S8 [Actinomycetota bacterium]